MTYDDFWYGDIEMLSAYEKAYVEKINFESWLNGYYTSVGQMVALANAFSTKKKDAIEYPKYVSISENKEHANGLTSKMIDKPRSKNDNEYLSQFY